MAGTERIRLTRPVSGIQVYSRRTVGACIPTFGRVELDFEPLPVGLPTRCEFACTVRPEPAPDFEQALVDGLLRELAGGNTEGRDGRVSEPVRARVIVRAMSWHFTESHELVFFHLGGLAVREALRCAADGCEPQPIETRVRPLF